MVESSQSAIQKIALKIPLFRRYGASSAPKKIKQSRPLLGILALAVLAAVALPLINITIVFPAYTKILTRTFEDGALRLALHTIPPQIKDQKLTKDSIYSPRFLADIYRLENTIGLLKLLVFSPDGTILYSSNASEIGKVYEKDYFSHIVAKGETFSKVSTKTKSVYGGHEEVIDVIETYVPIMNGNKFLGAFELYFDITNVKSGLDEFNTYATYGSIITSICLLLVAVVLLSKEASRVEALRQAEKLRNDVDQITRHDIKSPLIGAINGINYLERYTSVDEDQKEILADMRESVNTGLELINRSLDIYKMETGTYEYHQEPVDLLALARRVCTDLSGFSASKNVSTRIKLNGAEVANGEGVHIPAEESLLYSLLANLIKNAIEASPDDKQVTISITGDSDVEIVIHNQGVVPEPIRDTFFDKFVTAEKSGGTGLGTYSAQLMVRTMGGTISMNSSEENGTRITINMPMLTNS